MPIRGNLCLIFHTDRTDATDLNRSPTDKLFLLFLLSSKINLCKSV